MSKLWQHFVSVQTLFASALEIPIHVYGPETHMTAIVGMALGKTPILDPEEMKESAEASNSSSANFLLPTMVSSNGNGSFH